MAVKVSKRNIVVHVFLRRRGARRLVWCWPIVLCALSRLDQRHVHDTQREVGLALVLARAKLAVNPEPMALEDVLRELGATLAPQSELTPHLRFNGWRVMLWSFAEGPRDRLVRGADRRWHP